MQPDGNIDYRSYTLPQLREALSLIDGAKYPINHANLKAEIAGRPALPIEPAPQGRVATHALPGRSAGAAVFFGFCWFLFFWFVVGGIFAAAMTAAAGKGAGKNFSEGYAEGRAYGAELGGRYGPWFCYGGLILAIVGTATGLLPGTARGASASRARRRAPAERQR
jgi:hypothetical protein